MWSLALVATIQAAWLPSQWPLSLSSSKGPGALATPAAVRVGPDSLPLLRMDPTAWHRLASASVRVWVDAAKPSLHRLSPSQRDAFVRAVVARGVRTLWKSVLLKRRTADDQRQRGLLREIEVPVKMPGVLGQVVTGKAGLRVSGRQRLELGGKSSYQVGQLADPNRSNSKFPQLHMDQELRVSLKGNVGEKISVLVDHDSAARSSDRNKIRIRYEGTEDEILQEIEAGNTSLTLGSGPEFISPSFSHQGLFGIRGKAQVGPTTLTVIASKEESQNQVETFTGSAKDDTLRINDTQYVHNQFFAVLMPPGAPILTIDPTDSLLSLTVYLDNQLADPDRIQSGTKAICYLDPRAPSEEEVYRGLFKVLREGPEADYVVHRSTGILELRSPLAENDVLAVAYTSRKQGAVGGQVVADSVVLKLVKPPNPTRQSKTWAYELRNVYYLGSRSIDLSNFRLTIKRRVASGTDVEMYRGRSYLSLLGLDRDNNGLIDLDRSVVDPDRGLLFFPHPEPFNQAAVLDTVNPVIYQEQYTRLRPEDNLFYLEARYKLLKSTYDLSPFMIEGSEVVKVNGRTMVRGQDYDVEFYQLRFRPGVITGPDDRIVISYEVRPLFAAGQKTLLGARVEVPMSQATKVGATWMYQGEGGARTTVLPRFGEEPRRSMVVGTDARLEFRPSWLTDAANLVPLVTTDAQSSINLSAEVAYSMPNPNTRGGATIDDMEGNRISTSLPLVYRRWSLGSLPPGVDPTAQDTLFYWHNFGFSDPDKLRKGEIYPPTVVTDERERDELVEVLNLRVHPDTLAPARTWVALQTLVQAGGADFSEREYLEVLVRGEGGTLRVDLGAVSEDQARDGRGPNGILDTEDQHPLDGVWNAPLEDTGFDGLFDHQETGEGSDPSNDNYPDERTRHPQDYTRINKQEGNQREDTEDLDHNGRLDTYEAFFSLGVPLSGSSPFLEAEYLNGWKLFRIPLRGEHVGVVGNASWSNVEYARIWVDGLPAAREHWIQIAGLEVVGSAWRSLGVGSPDGRVGVGEEFRLKVRNNKEDALYQPPFDPGKDERTGYVRREQSLVMAFQNLEPGHWGSAYQAFHREQDYSGYEAIAVWVRPHQVKDYTGQSVDPVVWVRIGATEAHYYEIRFRPRSDEWHKLQVPTSLLTRTKVEGSLQTPEGYLLSVVGVPSITRIRRVTVGVENPSGRPLSGEVWVDELQLARVKRAHGLARRSSLKVQMADLASIDVDLRGQDATFTRLDQRGSTAATSEVVTQQVSGTLALDQFFPDRWGIKVPASAAWSSRTATPRLATGTDVALTAQEQERQRSEESTSRFNLSLSKTIPSKNPLVNFTLDKMRLSYSTSLTRSTAPVQTDTARVHQASLDWSWAPKRRTVTLPFVKWNLSYTPSTVSLGMVGQQRDQRAWVAEGDSLVWSPRRFVREVTQRVATGFQPFSSLDITYSFNAARDLTYHASSRGEDLLDDRLRPTKDVIPFWRFLEAREMRRSQQVSARFAPRVAAWLDPSLTYDTSYSENHDPALTAATPDSHDVRDAGSNTSSRLRATFSPSQFLDWVWRLSGRAPWLGPVVRGAGRLHAIQTSIGVTATTNYRELGDRPPGAYQLGLRQTIAGYSPYDRSQRTSWDVSGGLQVSRDIRLSARASGEEQEREFSGASVASSTRSFPDVEVSWTGLHALKPLKDKVASSTVRTAFRVSEGSSGRYQGGLFRTDETNRRVDFSPRLSVSMTLKSGLTLSLTDTYGREEKTDLTQAQALERVSRSRRSSLGLQYAFSAPRGVRVPVAGTVRFKSNLRLTLDVSRERRLERTGSAAPTVDTSSWFVKPGASYDFGVVDSGLQIEVGQTTNRRLSQTRREIGLRIWVNFPF